MDSDPFSLKLLLGTNPKHPKSHSGGLIPQYIQESSHQRPRVPNLSNDNLRTRWEQRDTFPPPF